MTDIVTERSGSILRIQFNRPAKKNAMTSAMYITMAELLNNAAKDDSVRVVLWHGAGDSFCAGNDLEDFLKNPMGPGDSPQSRLINALINFDKPIVAAVHGFALAGGFEMALMTDISVIASDTRIGMPATRFLGPALGSLHMFFHRLGPVLARRLLLTGDIIEAGEIEHLGIFTDTCDPGSVTARARYWAEKAAKMPADGVVIAKEAFRLVEQSQAYQGEEVASYLFHAFGTNLQFAPDEFNFVKTRAQHGAKEAFRLRDEHFHVPEPEA